MKYILGSRKHSFENGKTTVRKNDNEKVCHRFMMALNANRNLVEAQ